MLTFVAGGVQVSPLNTSRHAPSGAEPLADEVVREVRDAILTCLRGRCPTALRVDPTVVRAADRSGSSLGVLSVDRAGHPNARTAPGHGYARHYDLGRAPVGPGWWVVAVGSNGALKSIAVIVDLPMVAADAPAGG